MIDHIHKLRDQITMQANNKKKKNKEDLENVKTTFQKITSALNQADADMQTFKAAEQECQLFIVTKRVKTLLQSYQVEAREIDFPGGEMMYHFERDESLHKICKELDTFGKLQNPECFEAAESVANGVVVLNVPEEATYDDVELYFESTKRSHGGETVKVDVHVEEKYAIILFKDPRVVSRVCLKKDHILTGHHVDILPCIEYLGLPQSFIVLDLDPVYDKIRYLKEMESGRSLFEKELSKCHAEIIWNEHPLRVQCTLEKDDRCERRLRSWKKETCEVVKRFTDKLFVKVITVTDDDWNDVKEALTSMTVTDPDTVAVHTNRNTCQVKVVGYEGYTESDLSDILDKLKDFDRS